MEVRLSLAAGLVLALLVGAASALNDHPNAEWANGHFYGSGADGVPTLHKVDPDANYNFAEILESKGYACETHNVTTEDGYILGVFRIPGAGPPVFLQHGLLDSSFTWLLNEPGQALAYLLADEGYDVWMGNNRGNFYSKNHTTLSVDSDQFWEFSWDEMARYDFPAMVSYALQQSGAEKLVYVGHSEGTTQAFAALSTNNTYEDMLHGFVALGPVVTVGHMANPILRALADMDVILLWDLFGINQFFPTPTRMHEVFVDACADCEVCCAGVVELICGIHVGAFNNSRMPVMAGHEPGGTSVQNVQHWTQMVKSGLFQMYDYGRHGNEQHYGQSQPPVYDVSRMPQDLPLALFSGSRDVLADPTDVAALVAQLPQNVTRSTQLDKYAHLDYVWALDATQDIYADVLQLVAAWST